MAALNDSYENGFVHSICSATLTDPLIPSDFAQPGTNCLAVTLTTKVTAFSAVSLQLTFLLPGTRTPTPSSLTT